MYWLQYDCWLINSFVLLLLLLWLCAGDHGLHPWVHVSAMCHVTGMHVHVTQVT